MAFADLENQLPSYLEVMDDAGLAAVATVNDLDEASMWRKVPHRKWYVRVCDPDRQIHAPTRCLLLHRAAR
jgi:hypothetical protein